MQLKLVPNSSSSSSIQFYSSLNIPSDWRWLDASHYFHNSSYTFSPPTSIYCIFFLQTNSSHTSFNLFLLFILSQHCLHFPFTSCTIDFIKNIPQVISKHDHTISHHLPLPVYAASFNPNMSISSNVFLLSTNFTPCIALTIDLSALLKIATLFSLKHHILLPYNIADLT